MNTISSSKRKRTHWLDKHTHTKKKKKKKKEKKRRKEEEAKTLIWSLVGTELSLDFGG